MPLQQVAHSPISEFILEIVLAKPKLKISKGQVRANKRENKKEQNGRKPLQKEQEHTGLGKISAKRMGLGERPTS